MKIDLHCHTKRVLPSDGSGRNVTASVFAQQIADAEIGIAAITNHNYFNKEQYVDLRDAVKDYCQVWPGVELTMESETNIWHLIIVCNPNQLDEFDDALNNKLLTSNPNQASFAIPEVVDTLDHLDIVYIPHDYGKRSRKQSRAIPFEKRQELSSLSSKPNRIISEPNHHSLGVLSKHGYRVILGSDVKDWSRYKDYQVADFRIPIASFTAFTRLVEGDVSIYNDIALSNDAETKLRLKPVPESNQIDLSIYRGVNIIFGQKGTGKSKLIEAINTELLRAGFNSGLYKAGEVRKLYDQELSSEGLTADASSFGRGNLSSDFEEIVAWKEESITSIKSYLDYKNGIRSSKNRNRLVIADHGRTEVFEKQASLKDIIADQKHIESAISELDNISFEQYIDADSALALKQILNMLLASVNNRRKGLLVEKYSIAMLNNAIRKIKEHAESLCETPSAPNGTGFLKFANNRIILRKSLNRVLNSLDGAKKDEIEYFGYLDDKGQINLVTRRLVFKDGSSPKEYFSGKKTSLEKARKSLKRVLDNIFSDRLVEDHAILTEELSSSGVSSYDDFVGIKRFTALNEEEGEYEPSDGELAIIMMKRFLDSDLDYYLLDEPEKGMGNSYVDKNIRRDEIMRLVEQRKTIVLATHNANLAVRTMPVFSFLLEYHGKNKFEVYAGSPFSNLLSNINDSSDTRTWTKQSMEILEGGEEAFYDRKDMYELC